ncbi:hypothetical protein [Burkholderia phage BCSR5]|nr:hypothetical protein [Burkholderia phage BCSR5]
MGYIVTDRIELSLFINGVEFPLGLDSFNVMKFLHMAESVKFRVPTCHFAVTDAGHSLDKINLQDAIPIKIAVKGSGGPTRVYNFRKFNHKRTFEGDAFAYEMDGYFDAPRFWAGTAVSGFTGTSDGALSMLAQQNGLKYSGWKTNDSMTWMPGNRKQHAWASEIEAHAYAGDDSFMRWGIDLEGNMRYRNILGLQDSKKRIIAHQIVEGAASAVDYEVLAGSGFSNASEGYGNNRFVQSADGKGLVLSDLQFKADSRSPLFSKTMKEKVQRGRITHSPINFGTVHPNYERAAYQNARFESLYSLELSCQIFGQSYMDMFDVITFSTETEKQTEDAAYSGTYVVTGKAIYVEGATYSEKVFISRMGVNQPYVSA